MLSFGELIVVAVVAVLVLKPEDIKVVVKSFRKIKAYFTDIKSSVMDEINSLDKDLDVANLQIIDKESIERINDYIRKMSDLGHYYNGRYKLEDVRAQYVNTLKKLRESAQLPEKKTGESDDTI